MKHPRPVIPFLITLPLMVFTAGLSCRPNDTGMSKTAGTAVYARIKAAVDSIRLIDVHEHLSSEKLRLGDPVDFFYLFQHYSSSDLVAAGMPARDLRFLQDAKNPPEERWAKMAPFWPYVKFTGYGKALRIAARDLYGVPDIDETTWKTISERMKAANKPGFYDETLSRKAGIDLVILDCVSDDPYLPPRAPFQGNADPAAPPPGLFVYAKDFDPLISMKSGAGLRAVEGVYKTSLRTTKDIATLLDAEFAHFPEKGIVSVKCKLAYHRTLLFEDVAEAAAQRVLNLVRTSGGEVPFPARKPLEDWTMRRIVERCGRNDVPLQIHTGLQEGNGSDELTGPWDPHTVITDSNPILLVNLIRANPGVRFDVFHGGFPYLGEMTTMAKNFQNVRMNLAWLSIISPETCREWLHRWIETVPVNKIEFFGGDYRFAEGTYGHSVIAREIVARTLSEKVQEGYLTENEAVFIARRILRENAIENFRLQKYFAPAAGKNF